MERIRISLIITVYNRPDCLHLILQALARQRDLYFEVIIADDGSDSEVQRYIETQKFTLPYQLRHVWHPDNGFRAAQIRNKAAAQARGQYFIFIDGDCIPGPFFIMRHRRLAEQKYFVAGNRILLSARLTDRVLQTRMAIDQWNKWQWIIARLYRDINCFISLLFLPLPRYLRKIRKKKWQGAKTCNLALWKNDFYAVNGFDEQYYGWGYEDSDLIIRLMRRGIYRKDGHYAVLVWHLWHPDNDRAHESENLQRLQDIQRSITIRSLQGVDQYI